VNFGLDRAFRALRVSPSLDSNRLVIETGSYSGPTRESGAYSEHTEIWWLEGDTGLVMDSYGPEL
jgi:hypothetical protein